MQLIGVLNAQSEQINGTRQRHAACVWVCVGESQVLSVEKLLLQNLKKKRCWAKLKYVFSIVKIYVL